MRAALIALLLCGCQLPGAFVCHDDSECVDDGQSGVCASGACAFPVADNVCPSQLRYAHFATAALADQCYQPDYCAATRPDGQTGTFCDGLSVYACDDFEGTALDTAWTPNTSMGSTIMLDATQACRGKQSVRMTIVPQSGAAGAAASISRSVTPPNPLFGRAFYYFASPLPLHFNNVAIFSFIQNVAPFDGSQLVLSSDDLAINNYAGMTLGNIPSSQLVVPANTWVCVEWELMLNNPGGAINVWFDGKPVAELALDSTTDDQLTFPSALGSVSLSYAYSVTVPDSPTFIAWVDELILDGAPIGCTR